MQPSELMPRLAGRLREGGSVPVSRLVVEEIWLAVVEGGLEVGQRLPTAREVAIALNVSPRVIEHAYEELARRGVLVARPGAGTFVSLAPPSEAERERQQRLAQFCADTVHSAAELGFSLDDLLDALSGLRSAEAAPSREELRT